MRIMIAGFETARDRYDDDIRALEAAGRAGSGCAGCACTGETGPVELVGPVEAFLSLDPDDLRRSDGLILPGSSQDMNPKLWGEADFCSNDINDELDQAQWTLLGQAIREGKPVMGICRGMQFINVYFGGTLIQDLQCASAHKTETPERYHAVTNGPGSFMMDLFGPQASVNSRHHQGIGILGEGLTAVSWWQAEGDKNSAKWASDGQDAVIEAIAHKTLPVIGFQWHPEIMCLYGNEKQQADGAAMLQYFLEMVG